MSANTANNTTIGQSPISLGLLRLPLLFDLLSSDMYPSISPFQHLPFFCFHLLASVFVAAIYCYLLFIICSCLLLLLSLIITMRNYNSIIWCNSQHLYRWLMADGWWLLVEWQYSALRSFLFQQPSDIH